jgi:hypothetical protein
MKDEQRAENTDQSTTKASLGRREFLSKGPYWRSWIFLYPKGDPRNDFNAKVGLSFPIGKR